MKNKLPMPSIGSTSAKKPPEPSIGGLGMRLASTHTASAIKSILNEASAGQWSQPLIQAIIARIKVLIEEAADKIADLARRIARLKEDLKNASPSEKVSIGKQISSLEVEMTNQNEELLELQALEISADVVLQVAPLHPVHTPTGP